MPALASPAPEKNKNVIKRSLPDWLINAPLERRLALAAAQPVIPDWYRAAPAESHKALKQAVEQSWKSQIKVDRLFDELGNVRKYAEPLLLQALKEQFGLTLDVRKTYLRLYIPKKRPVAYEIKTLSMLDAALHNFEAKEAAAHYFDSASCFITEPSPNGTFNVLPINNNLGIAEFVSLCRRLDIGGRYQQQLGALLLPKDGLAKAVLRNKVVTSQQDRFSVAIHLAIMKRDIGNDARMMLSGLLAPDHNLMRAGQTKKVHELSILGATLTGVVLFSANLEHAEKAEPVIVYVPDDPDHPLKEYASTAAFASELVKQLRSTDYQRFFARFIAHEHRGAFFAQLNRLLVSIKWHPHATGDARPAWRLEPSVWPDLKLQVKTVNGDLWTWLYQRQLDKILNDARAMAVPTADEDRQSRWEQWDALQNAASIIAQVAALVALPFVPFLGELMLAYTAYQLLDDTFTGILDWTQGQLLEASNHLLSIAETIAQLGAFAVGATTVGRLLTVNPSAFVDSLKIVEVGGHERLWNPDMSAYERSARLPADSVPDELGLHRHQDARVLPLEGRTYEIETTQDVYRIRHPNRSDAYKPRVTHNGVGAWALEVENPMEWQGAQLFRRLGHSVAEFSDVTAARILAVSGIDEAVLRDVHVHSRRPPALLEDTIRRFKRDQQIQAFARMAHWADDHRVDMFKAGERLFEQSSDANTQQMRRIFPDLPKTIARELWRNASASDRLHMQNNPGISRQMAYEALFYLREVRLSRACEGLYLDSVHSEDTDRLALHMLESLEGWSPDIRVEVRDSDFDGALLDSIGRSEASVQKVLVKRKGKYQPYDGSGQQLHGFEDLYGAVQHALSDAERQALQLPDFGQGTELKQAVRQQTLLPRPELRRLFGQPPLEPGARSPMGLAVGRSGYLLGGGDVVTKSVRSIDERLRALYPTADAEDLATIRSGRLTGDPLAAVARLENEYLTLVNELEVWVTQVPTHHPATGVLLDAGTRAEQGLKRQAFMQELKGSWSRQLTRASPHAADHFYLHMEVMGELPELSADFSHVTELVLSSRHQPLSGHGFFKSFSGVQFLTLEGLNLDAFPQEIFQMRGLVSLSLDNCALQLSEATAEGVARIESLRLLNLNNNPLGHVPDLGFMKGLRDLYLHNTGLKEVPSGLFELEHLMRADLTLNKITDVPDELFFIPDERAAYIDFSANPLNSESLRRIKEYVDNSSLDRQILIQVDEFLTDIEEEESDSESDSTDSAIGSEEESGEEGD